MKNNKPLRLFVDCHVFDGEYQGTRTYLEGLYKELTKDRDRHFFLAANDLINLKAIFGEQENITFIRYRSHSKVLRLLIDTPLLILKHKIDFAHFQYRVPPLKFCRYIVTIHDVLFEDFPEFFPKTGRKISYYTYRFSAEHSDIVLTVSPYAKATISKHLGVHNAIITPNGIADEFYKPYNKELVQNEVAMVYNLKNYFIYISRWEPRKNHLAIVKAFVNQKLYSNYSLLFVGDVTFDNPEYDVYYNHLPSEIKSRIVCLKHIPFKDVLLLLQGATLSIYPSIAEGFGIPPLETIAAGVPTLSSNTTAMADYNDFMGEYMFDPYDGAELEEKLSYILNHDVTADFNNMKNIIKQRYNWINAAKAFNKALQDYINK